MSLSQFVYGFIPHILEHKIINKQITQTKEKKKERKDKHAWNVVIDSSKKNKKEREKTKRKKRRINRV